MLLALRGREVSHLEVTSHTALVFRANSTSQGAPAIGDGHKPRGRQVGRVAYTVGTQGAGVSMTQREKGCPEGCARPGGHPQAASRAAQLVHTSHCPALCPAVAQVWPAGCAISGQGAGRSRCGGTCTLALSPAGRTWRGLSPPSRVRTAVQPGGLPPATHTPLPERPPATQTGLLSMVAILSGPKRLPPNIGHL